jgi:Cytochrome C oxidase subunit II, periplasmic domain
MSCCDQAAEYLITALGGEEVAIRVVGGVKWCQVRGVNGCVPEHMSFAYFILSKSALTLNRLLPGEMQRKGESRDKSSENHDTPNPDASQADTGVYEKEMDEMRRILYSHGGLSTVYNDRDQHLNSSCRRLLFRKCRSRKVSKISVINLISISTPCYPDTASSVMPETSERTGTFYGQCSEICGVWLTVGMQVLK